MSTSPPRLDAETPTLLEILRQRPGLLLRELCWRWGYGALLLALAGYDGWRIWSRSLPALRAAGALSLSESGLLSNPFLTLTSFSSALGIVWPQIERACWGLAPLAIFCWVFAFAWGRNWVLRRYDPRLPSRFWLHAGTELLFVAQPALIILLSAWLLQSLAALVKSETLGGLALFVILLTAVGLALAYNNRFRRALVIARAIALLHLLSFGKAFGYAWKLDRGERVRVLKKAVRRVRWMVLALAVVLTFVPAPFGLGWPLLAWWTLLSLPTLAATDAWQLGATLAVLQTFREPTEVFGAGPRGAREMS
jgi:hypothetical protein